MTVKTDKGIKADEEVRQDTHDGEMSHGGSRGEAHYGYGRQGGSVADTGTRTDVPVAVEQIESSALADPSPQTAHERQGYPSNGSNADRGATDTTLGVQHGAKPARGR